jgi:hypothetical protein
VPSLLLWRGGTPGWFGVSLSTSPLVKFAELVPPSSAAVAGSAEDRVCWNFALTRQLLHLLPVKGQEYGCPFAVNVRFEVRRNSRVDRTRLG